MAAPYRVSIHASQPVDPEPIPVFSQRFFETLKTWQGAHQVQRATARTETNHPHHALRRDNPPLRSAHFPSVLRLQAVDHKPL